VRIGPYTLAALIWRANRRCTWCTRVVARATCSIDHVIPRVRGGTDDPRNLVLACRLCNLQRYDLGIVPPRARRAGRSAATCGAEIARQTAIPVGRGTAANVAAREIALAWFGAYIERNRKCLAKRRAGRVDATAFPFGCAA
jgi:hypothetical protein